MGNTASLSPAAAAPVAAPRALRDPRVLVAAFSVFLVVITWAAIAYTVALERDLTLRTAVKETANLARAFEEHVVRTIRQVDQVALFVKDEYERNGAAIDLARYTAQGRINAELYNQVGVIEPTGLYILSNLPDFKPMNLADREHFRAHIERDSGVLFVGKPVLGRASGKWSIQLTRRINNPDGSFGGVVVVSVDPFYFSHFYRQVDLGPGGLVTLVGRDGIVRARQSGENSAVGQDLRGAALFEQLARADTGNYVADSAIDGVRRILSYRALQPYPFVVQVGTGYDDAFAEFEASRNRYFAGGALLTAAAAIFCFALIRRIDREHRAKAELVAARERAESANRMKSEFLASMSHELRTPLNGILGFAGLLEEDLADAEHRGYAGLIRTSGEHLLELVNHLLDLAKIEAGRMEVVREPVALRALLEDVVQTHAGVATAKGLACSLALDTELPELFDCDRTKLVQVLNNLLHNAVKFTERGEVEVVAQPEGRTIRFEVRDTGPGIPAADQAVIFEKFVQGEGFLTRRHAGTGLGLALARELIELMGGHIALRSAPGEGSVFHFALPVAGRAPEAA